MCDLPQVPGAISSRGDPEFLKSHCRPVTAVALSKTLIPWLIQESLPAVRVVIWLGRENHYIGVFNIIIVWVRQHWNTMKNKQRLLIIIIIIKIRWALFVTYTIIQSITSSEMCSLYLTHPSAHTPGAVGSGTRGTVGGSVPCSRVSPQSWTIPAGAEIQTHNLGLQVQLSIH